MRLKKGYIYWFKYANYHNDPEPMALILHPGIAGKNDSSGLVHTININYLKQHNLLTNQVLDMIAKVAAKSLSRNTYTLYHDYMKSKMPRVIQKAYRTYKPEFVRSIKPVSRGWFELNSFLDTFKRKTTKIKKTKEAVTFKVKEANKAKQVIKPMKISEAEKFAKEYMNQIQKIKLDKVNMKHYTGIKKV